MDIKDLPVLAETDAIARIKAGEKITGYHIDRLDFAGQELSQGLRLENCRIGSLNLLDTHIKAPIECIAVSFLGPVHCGWERIALQKEKSTIFDSPVTFKKSTFHDIALFGGAHFKEVVAFQETIYRNKAVFRKAHFEQQAYFFDSHFDDEVYFQNATFGLEGYFGGCRFMAKAFFEEARFLQREVSFNNIHAEALMDFSKVKIEGYLAMRRSQINGFLNFKEAHFHKETDFTESHFRNHACFEGAIFSNKVDFSHAQFYDEVSFIGCKLQQVLFLNAKFHEEVLFNHDSSIRNALKKQDQGAHFVEKANFVNAHFHKRAIFEQVVFENEVNFANSYFGERASFEQARFTQANFSKICCNQELSAIGATFDKVDFDYANINRRLDLSDVETKEYSFYKAAVDLVVVEMQQIRKRLRHENPDNPQYHKVKEEYLLLKKSFHQRGLHEEEDWAYRKFRQTKRKASTLEAKNRIRGKKENYGIMTAVFRVLSNAMERIIIDRGTGYGTQPLNITIVAISVVLLFGAVYSTFPNHLVKPANMPFRFSQAVYFSLATFTTMGFGDIQPKLDSFIRYIVSAEVFIGLFIMTLFVGTYTRKIIR